MPEVVHIPTEFGHGDQNTNLPFLWIFVQIDHILIKAVAIRTSRCRVGKNYCYFNQIIIYSKLLYRVVYVFWRHFSLLIFILTSSRRDYILIYIQQTLFQTRMYIFRINFIFWWHTDEPLVIWTYLYGNFW